MYGYVYKVTNLINGKIYIGQHVGQELDDKYYGSGISLKKAISKYGIQNFKVAIVKCCDSKKELNEYERLLIRLYNSRNPNVGYNIALGGNGGDTTSSLPDEIKKQINAKRSYSLTHLSPEKNKLRFERLSKSSKGRPQSYDVRRRKSATLMGHPVSDESRAKISKIVREYYKTEAGLALKKKTL